MFSAKYFSAKYWASVAFTSNDGSVIPTEPPIIQTGGGGFRTRDYRGQHIEIIRAREEYALLQQNNAAIVALFA